MTNQVEPDKLIDKVRNDI